MNITIQRIEMEEVMINPPRIVLLPAVHHYPICTEVAHVHVRFVAFCRKHVDHEIGDEAVGLYVRVLQSIFTDNLQQVHVIAPVILTSVRIGRHKATGNSR